MPYNNTPITPQKEVTGTVSLPLARVKKIIATDDDISNCSNNAAFVITAATEMFLQHLVEQCYNIVRTEKKPRRNIQYRDVANAVARVETLEFLTDVVPKTTTYRQFKQKPKAPPAPAQPTAEPGAPMPQPQSPVQLANGQSTLDAHMSGARPGSAHRPGSAGAPIGDVVIGGVAEPVGVEMQATNGAAKREEADVMEVDEVGAPVPVVQPSPFVEVAREGGMEQS